MAKRTPIYSYYTMEYGDYWWPRTDRQNMLTVENQLYGQYKFVGPGIYTGWNIIKMPILPDILPPVLTEAYESTIAERTLLRDAPLGSNLNYQYTKIGSPSVFGNEDIWSQIVKVTPGSGIVGVYAAKTEEPYYFRLQNEGEYDVYATPGLCLLTQGIAEIVIPDPPQENYAQTHVATYLGCVVVVGGVISPSSSVLMYASAGNNYFETNINYDLYRNDLIIPVGYSSQSKYISYDQSSSPYYVNTPYDIDIPNVGSGGTSFEIKRNARIYDINCYDQRIELNDLSGQLQQVLKLSLYRHVHIGGYNNPSKIQLSTDLILNAYGPTNTNGSPIFQIYDYNGNVFTWKESEYGIPVVRLNGNIIPSTEYRIESRTGRIYLKNSLPSGSVLQVVLPLAMQVRLTIAKDSNITSSRIYLTGIFPDISYGNTNAQGHVSWNANMFKPPQVYLRGVLQPSSRYTINASQGYIQFVGGVPSELTNPRDSDLLVVLTVLKYEIDGILSGKRIKNIDAATFNRGVLSPLRIGNLDHVGQVYFKEPATLRPNIRLFDSGDHNNYYPEIINCPVQYNTDILGFYKSSILSDNNVVILTKRGLKITDSGFTDIYDFGGWNIDFGKPVQVMDNILNAPPYTNYFNQIYARTLLADADGVPVSGRVFFSDNNGATWNELVLPTVATSRGKIRVIPTSFWVSTERQSYKVGRITYYRWLYYLYIGTYKYGLFRAVVRDGQKQGDWSWQRINFQNSGGNPTTIYDIVEVCTLRTTQNEDDITEEYERSVYLAADDGFYAAIKSQNYLKSPVSWLPKKIHWIKEGLNNNNIIISTDSDVYITHSARQIITSADNPDGTTTTTTYWKHPLETTGPFMFQHNYLNLPIVASTTSEDDIQYVDFTNSNILITTDGSILDGVSLGIGDTVLIKNFTGVNTSSYYNGLWNYLGNFDNNYSWWSRDSAIDSTLEATTSRWMQVCGGEKGSGSAWNYIPISGTINNSEFIFEDLWTRGFSTSLPEMIVNIDQLSDGIQYWVMTSCGLYRILDTKSYYDWNYPIFYKTQWNYNIQKYPKCIIPDTNKIGTYVAGSERGIWKTNSFGMEDWYRNINIFDVSDIDTTQNPTIYNSKTLTTEYKNNYILNQNAQSVRFLSTQPINSAFVMEKDYKNYYLSSWNPDGANVVIYENGNVSHSSYILDPLNGIISFDRQRPNNTKVAATIIRDGAFISGIGTIPHEEILNTFVTSGNPVTKLRTQLTPSDRTIDVQDISCIPYDTQYIEVVYRGNKERIPVVISNGVIFIPTIRTTTFIFPVNSDVFVSKIVNVKGIEDYLSIAEHNNTYHMASITGDNIIQLSIESKYQYPEIWNNFYGIQSSTNVNRGPINAIYQDLNIDGFDTVASSSTIDVSVVPTHEDRAVSPQAIYCMYGVSLSGDGMYVGSDQGIWKYNENKWHKESDLNNTSRIYSILNIDNNLSALTDNGVWSRDASGKWNQSGIYIQPTFDYSSGSWFDGNYKAYGKNDGLVFIKTGSNIDGFISDHFDPVDGKNVYGLYKDQFFRVDSQGNKKTIDALYLCTENGLYGVTEGARSGQLTAFLGGREMFGYSQTMNINGVNIPVKFYKITRSPRQNAVPLICLSNDGVRIVRNWRWCDPTGSGDDALDFVVESKSLSGHSVYCCVWKIDQVGDQTVYKLFVGTDRGVYRSFNEGYSFERCERIGGNDVAVFDLKSIGDCIFAATKDGIFTSSDDGDYWHKPSDSNSCATFDSNISSGEFFVVQDISSQRCFKAQTFTTPSDISTINKIGMYFGVDSDIGMSDIRRTNTLNIELWDADNGIPTSPLAGIGTFVYRASGEINAILSDDADINSELPQHIVEVGNTDILTWDNDQYPQEMVRVYLRDVVKNDGYIIDNNSGTIQFNPKLSGYNNSDLRIVLKSNFDPYFGFKSFCIDPPNDLLPNKQYAIVAYENVGSGSTYAFQIFRSNLSNPYSGGNICFGIGGTSDYPLMWTSDAAGDFYFKTYYSGLNLPVDTTNYINFSDGDILRGCVISDNNELSTHTKFAAVVIIDNSRSSTWSNDEDANLYQRRQRIGDLIESLIFKTRQNGFSPTNVDLWLYGSGEKSITNGFTTSISALRADLGLYNGSGLVSSYIDSSMRAISGINPQSIVDAVSSTPNGVYNVYEYMDYNNLIRINDIRKYYDSYADKAVVLKILPPYTISTTSPIALTEVCDGTNVFKYNILNVNYKYIDLQINGESVKRDTFENFKVGVAFTYSVNSDVFASTATIDNINGTIAFKDEPLSSQLSNDDLRISLRTDWDGEKDTITQNDLVSSYLVNIYAKSFTPVALIFTDGDNVGSGDTDLVTISANSAWDDDGLKLHIFSLGTSALDKHSRYMADNTNGDQFIISNLHDDIDEAVNDLFHQGNNTLFTSRWNKTFEEINGVWLKDTKVLYDQPAGTNVTVKFRYSTNKIDWSEWIVLYSGAEQLVNDIVYKFEYDIVMNEGWDNIFSVPIYPSVYLLQYTTVQPSTKFFVTKPYSVGGMLFEYLLSPSETLPVSCTTNWGIIRGNSSDVADMENIFCNRHGCLPNRQNGIRYIPLRKRPPSGNPSDGLYTYTTDYQTYHVYESTGSIARWDNNDSVAVYADSIVINPSLYQLFGDMGVVYFNTPFDPNLDVQIRVVITTPEKIEEIDGEPTYTYDYRTYYLSNGSWSRDSSAIVLVNGNICYGGYWENPKDGTITFATERQNSDVVSVYIRHAPYFRVGVIVKNYNSEQDVAIDNYGLLYTVINNNQLLFKYNNPPLPSLIGVPSLSSQNSSIYSRMVLDYIFDSGVNNTSYERNTQTRWYRRYISTTNMSVVGIGSSFVTDDNISLYAGDIIIPVGIESQAREIIYTSSISPYYVIGDFDIEFGPVDFIITHGLRQYDNRVTQPTRDVGVGSNHPFSVGDMVYADVAPSNGILTGRYITSNTVILRGSYTPCVWNPFIISVQPDKVYNGYRYVPVGGELKAQYNFRDLDHPSSNIVFNPDMPQSGNNLQYANPVVTNYSSVIWYKNDQEIYYRGSIIPEGYTRNGDVLNFVVLPFDGEDYGDLVVSDYVIVSNSPP